MAVSKHITTHSIQIKNKAPWLWICCGALLFSIVFTSGYAVRLIYKESGEPVVIAASNYSPEISAAKGYNRTVSATGVCSAVADGDNVLSVTSENTSCLIKHPVSSCKHSQVDLCHADLEVARTAWKYFENNYNPDTGLVNAVDNYPSTTMWDTGSALAATVTAHDLGLIDSRSFDQKIMAMFKTLSSMELFNNEAPNKVYNTKSVKMVGYGNQETAGGIGVSVLDLGRLISWLNTLNCMHPQYHSAINAALSRWDFSRLIKDGSMYGMARDGDNIRVLQEGRLGYEQYAAKVFQHVGFDLPVASSYENQFRSNIDIMDVSIAHDTRDPRVLGANNYVVTESYAMDAMELGIDNENRDLLRNIFEVQKKRWLETGIVTAISEDNIDQEPWFLYNTIFNAGLAWQTIGSSNTEYNDMKTTSVKAALSMAMLFPDDEYSHVLTNAVQHAYNPERGWYSGIYENGSGYNTAITANTNGVILAGLLYKKYGALIPHCKKCSRPIKIDSPLLKKDDETGKSCEVCTVAQH